MVGYATIVLFISFSVMMFIYTIFWDPYVAFWNIAAASGADSNALGVLYAIHQYLPVGFFFSMGLWYLAQAQRRDYVG